MRGGDKRHSGLVSAFSVSSALGAAPSPHLVEDRVAASDGRIERMTEQDERKESE